MFTQKKSPITHFVLTGICAAVLAACASSNGEPGSPTSPSVAPNDISNNTNKGSSNKDNANKPTTGKDNAGKDNSTKPNTGKDDAGKDNTGKNNATKPNTGKDNLAQVNEQISKNIQNKLVTLRLNDTLEKEEYKFAEFSQAEVDTGFIANNFAANPLLEEANPPTSIYDSSHIVATSGGRGKYKILRPQTVILGGVATRYTVNKIDGYIKREYGYDEIDTPLNSINLIGVDKRNANGILIKQGSSVNILDQTASKFELDSVGGSRYTQWFNNFETNADNKTVLDKGRRVLANVEYKLKKIQNR